MTDFLTSVIAPPRQTNVDGKARRLGVEIEFAGLNAKQAAGVISEALGGEVAPIDPHRYEVVGTRIGNFRVELDTRFAHAKDMLTTISDPSAWLTRVTGTIAEAVGDVGSAVVPCEVVTPPVLLDDVEVLDGVLTRLKEAGAQGTDRSVFYAFGVHLNPEVATVDPNWLRQIMRAQILLSSWLRKVMQIDTSRLLTGFAAPYSDAYADLVLDAAYRPGLAGLADDYLHHNPSRDYELDMLPLFAWIDEERVRSALPEQKIGKRPTFHFRLPNSALERPTWSIALEWNRWCLIERLADQPEAIDVLAGHYLQTRSTGGMSTWAEFIGEWLVHDLHGQMMQRGMQLDGGT